MHLRAGVKLVKVLLAGVFGAATVAAVSGFGVTQPAMRPATRKAART